MREVEQLGQRFVANLGGAMFVLLPGYALWLQLVYRNRRLRYTEHLVFALHVHAFWFTMLALSFAGLPGQFAGGLRRCRCTRCWRCGASTAAAGARCCCARAW